MAGVAEGLGSNRLFQVLVFYCRSPESGDMWYKSEQLKSVIWSAQVEQWQASQEDYLNFLIDSKVLPRKSVGGGKFLQKCAYARFFFL